MNEVTVSFTLSVRDAIRVLIAAIRRERITVVCPNSTISYKEPK